MEWLWYISRRYNPQSQEIVQCPWQIIIQRHIREPTCLYNNIIIITEPLREEKNAYCMDLLTLRTGRRLSRNRAVPKLRCLLFTHVLTRPTGETVPRRCCTLVAGCGSFNTTNDGSSAIRPTPTPSLPPPRSLLQSTTSRRNDGFFTHPDRLRNKQWILLYESVP